MSRSYNFSAGPAVLPEPVIKQAQHDLWDIGGTGVGIMEHSHRGAAFNKVIDDCESNIRKLAGISDDYDVLFLQGGASTQFFMAPMNWLAGGTADYVNTGAWSKKAIAEAKRFGTVHVAGSSEDQNYNYIPQELKWSGNPTYVHFTSNNTIFGTEWTSEPKVPAGIPLFCDASSDIFSRPIDISKYGLVYAGAQKNLGPSGVTLVIVRKELVAKGPEDLPTMLQYRTHANAGSRFNTPPAFGIYIVGETIKWILGQGGLQAVEQMNREKAKLLYDCLEESKMFSPTARRDSRSMMNVTFRASSEDLEKKFIEEAGKNGFAGLKGHRSVGGMRASIYNAFPKQGCLDLVEYLHKFEKENS